MATSAETKIPCCKCSKTSATFLCHGCKQSFCSKHVYEHRHELSQQMDNVGQEYDIFKRDLSQQNMNQTLFTQIDKWEKESIEKIQHIAETVRNDLKRLNQESTNRLSDFMEKISKELCSSRENDEYTEDDIDRWTKQLEELRKELDNPSKFELTEDTSSFIHLIKIKSVDSVSNSNSTTKHHVEEKLLDTSSHIYKEELTKKITDCLYPTITFGLDQIKDQDVHDLFQYLMSLPPMDKEGPMNGNCIVQTDQMETFLKQTFDFKNILGEYIVQGVKAFRLGRSPREMDPNTIIHFPQKIANSFDMTVSEIREWQSSYVVYASKDVTKLDKDFLQRALQGKSQDGEEAFYMKFVVRISTCPILMEFDAKVIPRKIDEGWPTRIKLVSVTGIDFAGRKHDIGDILQYVSNWRDIYEVNHVTDQILLYNERDLYRKGDSPIGQLHEDRLLQDLTYMARLRLRACDAEGVQIVVETGIGLGVFAGEQIGIDKKVRLTSALAIRTVLEQDGSSYKNIRAIIFALPIFNRGRSKHPIPDVFDNFVEQFQESKYQGCIPVMIADQDMHRLTVAIARRGFIVSELNPADSHGVFGEYWQNHGPAVEEKLALTTVGLLVQHHLINPHVLNPNSYHFI